MAGKSTTWNYWTGLALLGGFCVALAVGWWLGYRASSVEANAVPSEIESVAPLGSLEDSPQSSVQNLRSENDDLIRFIDEVYALLNAEGINIQLDLEADANGRFRLRADAAKIKEALKAKLREINAQ